MATATFTQGRLRLSDLANYETGNPHLTALTNFIQKKLRYASQKSILDDGHTWQGVMTQIYSQMDLQIRRKSILTAAVMDRQVAHQRLRRHRDDYNGGGCRDGGRNGSRNGDLSRDQYGGKHRGAATLVNHSRVDWHHG
ncbi:hypothetical protein CONLIGDRAFT_687633 [Coniochaeta ligniaria NRRL 30616]|uniref:Uncharacterized protein n=1 Tax=Coniochaeta ligniaria NRRL 30616 TaxID=1408157 RepID=A0A1J7IZR5_9PEZI|nr:hypothetical protein CONLIGDRAFT_687633 [Coniochaeta ligniaria NRRL 30616]